MTGKVITVTAGVAVIALVSTLVTVTAPPEAEMPIVKTSAKNPVLRERAARLAKEIKNHRRKNLATERDSSSQKRSENDATDSTENVTTTSATTSPSTDLLSAHGNLQPWEIPNRNYVNDKPKTKVAPSNPTKLVAFRGGIPAPQAVAPTPQAVAPTTSTGATSSSKASTSSTATILGGIAIPFQNLLVNHSQSDRSRYYTLLKKLFYADDAYAAPCGTVTASLYTLGATGVMSSSPSSQTTVNSDATFEFTDIDDLDIKGNDKVSYVIVVSGCSLSYLRPVTSDGLEQDATIASSLVSYLTNTDEARKLRVPSKKDVEVFLTKLSGSTFSDVYNNINNTPKLKAEWNTLFGILPSLLQDAYPRILELNAPTTINELSGANYQVSASHWLPTYDIVYLWKKDGVSVSTNANYTYTPSANDQGLHTIDLFVGKDDGSGALDVSRPYQHKSFSVTVTNSVPAVAPGFILANGNSFTTTRSITLEIDTGVALANCGDFSTLAFTENTTIAPVNSADYDVTCSTDPIQNELFTLTSVGDGVKTIRLWARDATGNISLAAYSFDLTLDTTIPSATISDLSGPLMGGSSAAISFGASDATSGLATLVLQYASDGVTFANIATPAISATSHTWTVPSDNVTTAKIRIIATDLAGNTSTVTSAAFTIDSTAPSVPGMALTSPSYSNSTAVTMTAASCTDIAGLFINEGTQPSASAAGWQACSTTASAITYTLIAATQGTRTVKVWAKDAVGNVSSTSSDLSFTFDTTVPTISLTSITGGQVFQGGSSQAITWTASDTNFDITPISAAYSLNAGSTWTSISATEANDGTLSWSIPGATNVSTARVRVTATDRAGNTTSATSASNFIIDTTAPSLTAASMSINGGSATTDVRYVQVSLAGVDNLSNITHFCLRYNYTTAPGVSDPCWWAVNSTPPDLTPATSLNLTNFSFALGVGGGVYTVTAWVKDAANNISSLTNGGLGTESQDLKTITYNRSPPPELTNIVAASSDAPSNPLTFGDMTVANGSSVYIKWKATDDNALPATPISLFYTINDSTFVSVVTNLPNVAGAGCSVDGITHTGCYVWTNNITSTYIKLRVAVADSTSALTYGTSLPLNSSPIRILAGNTDPGLGSAATAVILQTVDQATHTGYPGQIVVTDDGIVFIRDNRGLIRIHPSDGIATLWIPDGTAIAGENVPATSATLANVFKIALDYNNGLLLWDYDRIRRVDLNTNIISTFIGGGAQTADGIAPTQLQMSGGMGATTSFFALPNGNVYFQSSLYAGTTNGGAKIRIYNAADNTIQSLPITGTGQSGAAASNLATCNYTAYGAVFDKTSGDPARIIANMNCYATTLAISNANINPTTGASDNSVYAHPTGGGDRSNFITGRDGNLYHLKRAQGSLDRLNPITSAWTTVLGINTATGSCPDGTAATSCATNVTDAFITATGQIYFLDNFQIRFIAEDGKVKTLFGQSKTHGNDGAALSARFMAVNAIRERNSGHIVVNDATALRMREFSVGGNIVNLAGDGNNAYPNLGVAATNTTLKGVAVAEWQFTMNPVNGDIYYGQIAPYYLGVILKLNRATGRWEVFMGGGGTYYHAGDGMVGTSVTGQSYVPNVLGFDGTNIIASLYSTSSLHAMHKLYNITTGVQGHFTGVSGTYGTLCSDGTNTATCIIPATLGYANGAVYDSTGLRWLYTTGNTKIKAFNVGGVLENLVTTTSNIRSFAYRRNGGDQIVYYCTTTGSLRKAVSSDAGVTWNETAMTNPIATMTCSGSNMLWSSIRNSIIFPFTQNGLEGVAEYVNP